MRHCNSGPRVLNGLDPNQDRYSVSPESPDLGPKCLQRLSADNKVATCKERMKKLLFLGDPL